MTFVMRSLLFTLLLGIGATPAAAETPPSAEQVLSVFDEAERAELLRGEIVSKVRKSRRPARRRWR